VRHAVSKTIDRRGRSRNSPSRMEREGEIRTTWY
jgi:hypothetical protein